MADLLSQALGHRPRARIVRAGLRRHVDPEDGDSAVEVVHAEEQPATFSVRGTVCDPRWLPLGSEPRLPRTTSVVPTAARPAGRRRRREPPPSHRFSTLARREREGPPAVVTDRFEAAGIVMEIPDFEGSAVLRAQSVLAAMEELQKAGYVLALLPAGAAVKLERPRPRRRGPRT